MDPLQTGIDSLSAVQTSGQEYGFWFTIEIVLIVGVIIYQFYISRKVYKNICQFKDIFRDRLNVVSGFIERSDLNKKEKTVGDIVFTETEKNISPGDLFSYSERISISITDTSGSGIIQRIREDINLYLLNNYGAAVNFSIIKDIIDREVDIKDEEISNSIPTPLYLGLAATMIGIIFGLFAMPEANGQHFSEGIDALINGVKLAMFGSLSGLACTTILSSFVYKNAKRKISHDKNAQISYLQAKLLPELVKAEDTGVSGLKASLDRFARVATDISKNVLTAANQTRENIILQQEVIDKVGNLDVLKISETNLELFNRLESNMIAFNKFSEYVSLMSQISENLKDFASRTRSVDNIVNQIDLSLQENNRLSRFLTSHFEKIDTAGLAALKAVDLSDSHFKEAIEKLKTETDNCINQVFRAVNESASHFSDAIEKLREETDNRISRLSREAADNESKLAEIYHDISVRLTSVTSQHISEFQKAYSSAIPHFDQLDNLQILQKILEKVSDGVTHLQNDTNINTVKLIEALNQLNRSLTGVKDDLTHYAISKKSHGRKPKEAVSGFFRKLRNPASFFRRKRYSE
ncbi:MAG: hypothetical protein H6Q23_131 [Bacteroidetes bacterium]|nr:hypothetical protein [Bacteroidota bacterium]